MSRKTHFFVLFYSKQLPEFRNIIMDTMKKETCIKNHFDTSLIVNQVSHVKTAQKLIQYFHRLL